MTRGAKRGRPPYGDILTPAEWRVVHLAQHGLSNRDIARRRGVSLDAVKFHLANAVAKLGVANKRSVAWSCTKALAREGMQLALTYATDRLENTVRQLGQELGIETVLPCDVTQPEQMDTLVAGIDPVAVDARSTTLFGMAPDDLESTVEGAARGLGVMDLDQCRIREFTA